MTLDSCRRIAFFLYSCISFITTLIARFTESSGQPILRFSLLTQYNISIYVELQSSFHPELYSGRFYIHQTMADANIEKIAEIDLDCDVHDESTIEARTALEITNAITDLHAICGDTLTRLINTLDDDTHESLQNTVTDIYNIVLEDEISWGQIVLMFAFASEV